MRNFLKGLKSVDYITMELMDPSSINFYSVSKTLRYTFNKEVEKIIYKNLNFSKTVSSKIYDIDQSIWKQVIGLRLKDLSENGFNLGRLNYYVYGNSDEVVMITSLLKTVIEEHIQKILSAMDKFEKVMNSKNKYGVIRTVLSNTDNDTVIFIDMDTVSGRYEVYTGKIVDGFIALFSTPTLSTNSLSDFLIRLDLTKEYEIAKQLSLDIVDINDKLSAREIVDILKSTKMTVSVDSETGLAVGIKGMTESNSNICSAILNSFNLPYKSFKKLKKTRLSMKISSLTIKDTLKILTTECMSEELNITGQLISYISSMACNMDMDIDDLILENKV